MQSSVPCKGPQLAQPMLGSHLDNWPVGRAGPCEHVAASPGHIGEAGRIRGKLFPEGQLCWMKKNQTSIPSSLHIYLAPTSPPTALPSHPLNLLSAPTLCRSSFLSNRQRFQSYNQPDGPGGTVSIRVGTGLDLVTVPPRQTPLGLVCPAWGLTATPLPGNFHLSHKQGRTQHSYYNQVTSASWSRLTKPG